MLTVLNKKINCTASKLIFVLCIMILCFVMAGKSNAIAAQQPASLTWQDLKDDPLLEKQVTISVKHVSLPELFADINQQGAIRLSLAKDSALIQKEVTAIIPRMHLYDFMGAIARTYTAFWVKGENNEFILAEKSTDPIAIGISQIGNPLFYRYRNGVEPKAAQILQQRGKLYQKVLAESDLSDLNTKTGISLSSLPTNTVRALIDQYQQQHALFALLSYAYFARVSSSDNVIKMTVTRDAEYLTPPEANDYLDDDPLTDKFLTIELLNKNLQKLSNPQVPLSWRIYGGEIKQSKDNQD